MEQPNNNEEEILEYGGEKLTRADLSILRNHYLNLSADIGLLVELAAGRGISLFDEYAFAKRQVRLISQALSKEKKP